MEASTHGAERLIEKLRMAREIYQQASQNVQDVSTTRLFQDLAYQKSTNLKKLRLSLEMIDSTARSKSEGQVVKFLKEKKPEVENILSRMSDGEVLMFCINREFELISMYHNALNNPNENTLFNGIISSQLRSSRDTLEALEQKLPFNQF